MNPSNIPIDGNLQEEIAQFDYLHMGWQMVTESEFLSELFQICIFSLFGLLKLVCTPERGCPKHN